MDISLTKLPWYAQLIAFVVLGAAGVGVFYYYYEMPFLADLASRQSQLVSLRADINKGLATARKLPEFKAQVGDLESRLDSLKAQLPEEKDASDLLRRIQSLATESNLTIKGFKPAPTVPRQLHVEWPIGLQVEGNYHSLAFFLERIGKFSRIIQVSNINVKGQDKPDASGTTIAVSFTATTFVLLDKPAAPAGKPGQAPGKPGAPAAAPAKSAKGA